MRYLSQRFLIALVILSVVAVIFWWPGPTNAHAVTHEISIDAANFAYVPGRIEVNQGDRVKLTLTASDVAHGFALDGYDIKTRMMPGVSERIMFVADQAGKFRFRCSVSCGPLHPFMLGEFVIQPNNPFGKAVALVLIVVVGMLVYLWKFSIERFVDEQN